MLVILQSILIIMRVSEIIQSTSKTLFSFEVLPPLRGKTIDSVFRTIDHLMPYHPAFVEVTTHRTDYVYKQLADGNFQRVEQRLRPGTVAIASAIQNAYHLPVVPHLICSGNNRHTTEDELIDYSFLGIKDLLILRGDKSKQDSRFIPTEGGYMHATELIEQVNQFNTGFLTDGETHDYARTGAFNYGVACYPEKHEEAMSMQWDIDMLLKKQDLGAGYAITQMFFDNSKYFQFIERCRANGITIPIIPALKPIGTRNHCTMLPRTFHVDFPDELVAKLSRCQTDEDVKKVGIEWGIRQVEELKQAGVPCIHFYTMNAAQAVSEIAQII